MSGPKTASLMTVDTEKSYSFDPLPSSARYPWLTLALAACALELARLAFAYYVNTRVEDGLPRLFQRGRLYGLSCSPYVRRAGLTQPVLFQRAFGPGFRGVCTFGFHADGECTVQRFACVRQGCL